MRVVHIIKVIRVAGAEQHLLTLLEGLRQHHIAAEMLLLVEPARPMDDYVALLQARSIPVERLIIHRHTDVSILPRLRQAIRSRQPHIVHTHLIHADTYGVLAARWAGVPIVLSSRHNDDAFRHRSVIKLANRFFWRITDAGIAISDAIRDFTIAVEGARPAQLHTIRYGLDTHTPPLDHTQARAALRHELGLPPNTPIIGMVCRLVEQKGVTYGLAAFQRIAQDFPDVHLVIAGEGSLRPMLEAQAADQHLEHRVHFLGWRADAPSLMAGLDIFLLPSLWEGFGLVLLEAMSQQIPIIASRVSAIPEIVLHGQTGLLVPPRAMDELAAALRQLLTDSALRQHMGLLGRDRLEQVFDSQHMVQATAALYHQLME
jgi:glycosyltransferase involved in cell wall biosynthesis